MSCVSVGFAYLEARLSISGNVSVDVEIKDEPIDNIFSDAQSDAIIDFSKTSEEDGTKGLYLFESTKNDVHPIYYYRGAVENNNIIFADFCWKIVRTTETGGTKLIYNGIVGSSNTCDNTGESVQIGTSAFNSSHTNNIYIGYTYNSTVNSSIKSSIDTWYSQNIESSVNNKHYEKYLEDTVWCNDRSVASGSGDYIYYGAYGRLVSNKEPSLTCPQTADKYTVKSTSSLYNASLNGNKLLDYPVALLTADEVAIAGVVYGQSKLNSSYYLNGGQYFWLMSPACIYNSYANVFSTYLTGYFDFSYRVSGVLGVRPSISLKPGIKITTSGSGEAGTVTNPYKVVYN